MSVVRPFAALRPRAGLAARVAAVPYDVVNTDEARALASNPLSFLHVSRAEIDLPPTRTRTTTPSIEGGRGVRDPQGRCAGRGPGAGGLLLPAADGRARADRPRRLLSVDEYGRDLVKKHEKTRRDKEDDRTRHIIELRAQTGPVFLTYRRRAVDATPSRAGRPRAPPLYDFVAPDGVAHTVWQADRRRRRRASPRRSRTCPRSTSPTATIARRARPGRATPRG